MLNKVYGATRGYCYLLSPSNYKDIVHDAYVIWYDKTGRNLLEEHRGVIGQVIRNVTKSTNSRRKTYYWRGEKYYRGHDIEATSEYIPDETVHVPASSPDQLNNLIYKEAEQHLLNNLSPTESKVYSFLKEGYKLSEIADMDNTYRQKYSMRKVRIGKKAKQLLTI